MPYTYADLENRSGTIYNKKTTKGYADPTALAGDLGILPHQIDWTKISAYQAPTPAPAPAPTPTPTPAPTPSPVANLGTMTNEQYLAQGYFGGQKATPAPPASTPLAAEIASRATTPAPAPTPTPQSRTLIDIANSRPDVLNTAKSQGGDPFTAGTAANTWLNDWFNRVHETEYPGVSLVQPGQSATQPATVAPGSSGGATGGSGAGITDPKDQIIQQLLNANKSLQGSSGTLEKAYKSAQEAAGVSKTEEQIGSFDQEIIKTQNLLDQLTARITGGINKESDRLAPLEVITGRQASIQRAGQAESQNLINLLKTEQQGKAFLLEKLNRTNENILNQLNLKQKDIENAKLREEELDTYTDANGDRISVFYDQNTGATRSVNLGKVAKDTKTEIVETNGHKILIDSQTGLAIKDLGVATKASDKEKEKREKIVSSFNTKLSDWKMEGTREQFIRQLQAAFPDIDPSDIARKVYETYPDGYDQ